jgi:hypothetical protein
VQKYPPSLLFALATLEWSILKARRRDWWLGYL